MARSGESSLLRSGVEMFAANFTAFLGGALFWLVMARVVGLHGLGVGSSVVSAAGIVAAVLGGGFGLAFARHVAEYPGDASCAAAAGLLLGVLAAVLASVLGLFLGGTGDAAWALVLGFIGVASAVSIQVLVGLGGFSQILRAQAVGNLAKLVAGTFLGLMGFGAAAVLAGYLVHPLLLLSVAALYAGLRCSLGRAAGLVRSLLALGLSNSLFTAGNQLVQSLTVYLYAVSTRDTVATGILYLALMVAIVVAMPMGSLAAAALHHGVREGREVAVSAAPPGLMLAAVAAAAAAGGVRAVALLLGVPLDAPLDAVRVIIVVGPLLGLLASVLSELNRREDAAWVARVSGTRLVAAAVLLPLLSRLYGLWGAAAALLAATLAAVAVASLVERRVARLAAATLASTLPGLVVPASNWLLGAALATVASVVIAHYTLYPLPSVVRLLASTVKPRA